MSEININIVDNKRIGVDVQSGVNGQTVAANVNITDTASLYTATTVEGALQEVATNVNLKANKVQEAWITPTLLNSWVDFSTVIKPYYMKDQMGFVRLQGSVKNGTTPHILTLPVGYRPPFTLYFPVINGNTTQAAYACTITSAGLVEVASANETHISLDSICFRAV